MLNNTIDKTIDILKYWHKCEFFVPFDLDHAINIPGALSLPLANHSVYSNEYLPWLSTAALTQAGGLAHQAYDYFLYLLPFYNNVCTDISNKLFTAQLDESQQIEFEEKLNDEGQTCFAKLYIDKDGYPDFHDMSISTLPWALGKLNTTQLSEINISQFEKDKANLEIAISELLAHMKNNDSTIITDKTEPGIFTAQSLSALISILLTWSNFTPSHPLFAIIMLRKRNNNFSEPETKRLNPPTSPNQTALENNNNSDNINHESKESVANEDDELALDILNSFFIEDLEKAINYYQKTPDDKLYYYINGMPTNNRIDLYNTHNHKKIIEKTSLDYTNRGRWPSSPKQTMNLMQQMAINEIFNPTNNSTIFSVNGPPGTGKTTLLQDIIAENIIQRAEILASYDTIGDTFSGKKTIVFSGENTTINLLDPKLTGFEMLVCSSNNAAIENISKELPLRKKIHASSDRHCGYLEPVTAKLFSHFEDGKIQALAQEKMPWGLISVALGNANNRKKFVENFFFAPDADETKNKRIQAKKYLTIWEWKSAYDGPTFDEAKESFNQAKKDLHTYITALNKAIKLKQKLMRSNIHRWKAFAKKRLDVLKDQIDNHQTLLKNNKKSLDTTLKAIDDLYKEINHLEKLKPSFLSRIFRTQEARLYNNQKSMLIKHLNQLTQQRLTHQHQQKKLNEAITIWQHRYDQLSLKRQKRITTYQKLRQENGKFFEKFGSINLPPDNNMIEDEDQLTAFYQTEQLNQLRNNLFITGIKLHEAWLATALSNRFFNGNLIAISKMLQKNHVLNNDEALAIWQSLFFVVPVISSTFASIERQFKYIMPKQLGWLFVDEAGQALPQAVVGAMLRTKKNIIIGDPLQITPIVTTPIRLLENLAKSANIHDYAQWLPSQTSVQILADKANIIGAYTISNQQRLWIGCPLRVHRRCMEPMFSVSNQIAYDNKMINARPTIDTLDFILDESAWFDVKGKATDKQFIKEQGMFLLHLFTNLYQQENQLPKLYIITPFKRVKTNLQTLLRNKKNWETKLAPGTALPTQTDLNTWCRQSIGTIHTFQGKEVDTVILVLGADEYRQSAVKWASSQPNILNVAVTRARDRIYVIGDHELWANRPNFTALSQKIKYTRITSLIKQISLT